MATALARRPEPGAEFPQAVLADPAAAESQLPTSRRGIVAQAAAALGIFSSAIALGECSVNRRQQ